MYLTFDQMREELHYRRDQFRAAAIASMSHALTIAKRGDTWSDAFLSEIADSKALNTAADVLADYLDGSTDVRDMHALYAVMIEALSGMPCVTVGPTNPDAISIVANKQIEEMFKFLISIPGKLSARLASRLKNDEGLATRVIAVSRPWDAESPD